jgi:hypothetical protein
MAVASSISVANECTFSAQRFREAIKVTGYGSVRLEGRNIRHYGHSTVHKHMTLMTTECMQTIKRFDVLTCI